MVKFFIPSCFALVMAVAFAMAVAPAYAEEYTVDPDNFTTYVGTAPFTSPDKPFGIDVDADNNVKWYQFNGADGDIVTFEGGTYILPAYLKLTTAGTDFTGNLTLRAAEGADVIFIRNNTNFSGAFIWAGSSDAISGITIEGITFISNSSDSWQFVLFNSPSNTDITIRDNVFKKSNVGALLLPGSDIEVSGNEFENIGLYENGTVHRHFPPAIKIDNAQDVTIQDNTFTNVTLGVDLEGVSNAKIHDNTFTESLRAVSVGLSYNSGIEIYDNTMKGVTNTQFQSINHTLTTTISSIPHLDGMYNMTAISVRGAGGVEVHDNTITGFEIGFFLDEKADSSASEAEAAQFSDLDSTTASLFKNQFINSTNHYGGNYTIYNDAAGYTLPATLNYFEDEDGQPLENPLDFVYGEVDLVPWSVNKEFTRFGGTPPLVHSQIATTTIHSQSLCGISISDNRLKFSNTIHGTESAPLSNTVQNIGTDYVDGIMLTATPWTDLEGAKTFYKQATDADAGYTELDGLVTLSGDPLIRLGPTVDSLSLDFKLDLTDTDGSIVRLVQKVSYAASCG